MRAKMEETMNLVRRAGGGVAKEPKTMQRGRNLTQDSPYSVLRAFW